jgi:hypothetical protein
MTLHTRAYFSAFIVLFFLLPIQASAATLSLSPSDTSVSVGSTIIETVIVSSSDQAMNAISGTITFPANTLQVVSISKANSVLSLWVQDPTFSNTNGTISFSGVVPNPGFTGNHGQVISIQFRGKKAGVAKVSFSSESQVLANDGNGTDVLTATSPATVTVTSSTPVPTPPPTSSAPSDANLLAHITSSTHPDQTQWYKLTHAVFDWTNDQNISAVRIGYDKNANGKPSVIYNDLISHKELDLSDGIWYFHVQEKGPNGWGPIASYRIQIDSVSPLPFTVLFPNGTTTKSGSMITTNFSTTDELSGIEYYQVSVDGKEFKVAADEGSRPYAVLGDSGTHLLLVRAYDKAGNVETADGKFSVTHEEKNSSIDFFTFGWLAINYISFFLILLAILITLLFAAWYIRTHFTAYRRQLNHRLGLTHNHVHREFDNLKGAITEEVLTLEQAKSRRALTREEERLVKHFKELLEQAEQAIEKDLEDIQK